VLIVSIVVVLNTLPATEFLGDDVDDLMESLREVLESSRCDDLKEPPGDIPNGVRTVAVGEKPAGGMASEPLRKFEIETVSSATTWLEIEV
jgi:hypothetical protein